MSQETASLSGIAAQQASVLSAVRVASERTGVDFQYLLETAKRESSLNPDAKASTSSAAGLFQFIEQTWLSTIARYGDQHGLQQETSAITRQSNGRYQVENPQTREAILNLRFNPQIAATMAARLTAENGAGLEKAISGITEQSGPAALYAAHFLGVKGAITLFQAPPNASAATLFPAAAKANPSLFFNNGQAVTAGALISSFAERFSTPAPAPDRVPIAAPWLAASNEEISSPQSAHPSPHPLHNAVFTSAPAQQTQLPSQLPPRPSFNAGALDPAILTFLFTMDPVKMLAEDGRK